MKISKSLIAPITAAFSILLSGCAYTTTSNTFSYHGTDLQNTSEPFSYVEKNIVGSAATAYTWRGGGNTRNGLIADAFENLNNQFKLDVNQALANVAIDLMEVESGLRTPLLLAFFSGVSYVPSDFTTIVSIRADVIEFGSNSPWALEEAGLVRILNEGPIKRSQGTLDGINDGETTEANSTNTASAGNASGFKFSIGDRVHIEVEGSFFVGQIIDIQHLNNTARVRYKINNRSQEGFFFFKDIHQIQ